MDTDITPAVDGRERRVLVDTRTTPLDPQRGRWGAAGRSVVPDGLLV